MVVLKDRNFHLIISYVSKAWQLKIVDIIETHSKDNCFFQDKHNDSSATSVSVYITLPSVIINTHYPSKLLII